MLKKGSVLISMMAAGIAGSSVQAEPESTDRERAAIEAFLKKEGYVSWEEINLDDNLREADDPDPSDIPGYEIDLEPETLRIKRIDRRFVAVSSPQAPRTTESRP